MSQENVELVQRAIEVANRRDLDAVITSFAPDAVFEGRALGDIFEGRPAIRNFLEDWFGVYEELVIGLEEVSDLGNGVVFAVVIQDARAVGSAGHLRQREGWVFLLVRGLIARLTISEIDEARAAVGLSEQDAHAEPSNHRPSFSQAAVGGIERPIPSPLPRRDTA